MFWNWPGPVHFIPPDSAHGSFVHTVSLNQIWLHSVVFFPYLYFPDDIEIYSLPHQVFYPHFSTNSFSHWPSYLITSWGWSNIDLVRKPWFNFLKITFKKKKVLLGETSAPTHNRLFNFKGCLVFTNILEFTKLYLVWHTSLRLLTILTILELSPM